MSEIAKRATREIIAARADIRKRIRKAHAALGKLAKKQCDDIDKAAITVAEIDLERMESAL